MIHNGHQNGDKALQLFANTAKENNAERADVIVQVWWVQSYSFRSFPKYRWEYRPAIYVL